MHAPIRSQALRLIAAIVLVGAGAQVSACSDGGGTIIAPPPPPPTPPAMGAARFGGGFATSFTASPNTDPREPAGGDIIAISLTTDPLEVP